jgi:hypothetical protein
MLRIRGVRSAFRWWARAAEIDGKFGGSMGKNFPESRDNLQGSLDTGRDKTKMAVV